MRGFLAVAWREIGEWRFLYWMAFALGWLPIFLTLLPTVSGYSKADVRTVGIGLILTVFGLLMPLALGASLWARDLAEGRAGFYFARPIGAWALWSGKVLAGWAAAWLALGLVSLPTQVAMLIFGEGSLLATATAVLRRLWASPLLPTSEPANLLAIASSVRMAQPGAIGWVLLLLALPLVLILLAHSAAVIWRDRSAWLGLDLLGLVSTLLAAALVARILWQAQAIGALARVQSFWGLWLVVVLLVAGGFQVAKGRADLLRSHRALALALWPLLLAGAVAPFAYARWVLAAGIEDIDVFSVAAAPAGGWLVVDGTARGRWGWQPSFLVDSANGRTLALGSQASVGEGFQFAADGRAAAWTECHGNGDSACEVKWLALDEPGAEPIATGIEASRNWYPFALSADGSRLALLTTGQQLSVFEVPAGRLIASVHLDPDEASIYLGFLSNEIVRFHVSHLSRRNRENQSNKVVTWHFDVAKRELRPARELDALWAYHAASDPYSSSVLDFSTSPATVWLVDGKTEAVRWRLEQGSRSIPQWRRFLADGKVVLAGRTAQGVVVVVISPAGEVEREVLLAGVAEIFLGYEVTPGRLSVGISDLPMETWPVPPSKKRWTTELLDVSTGEREKVLEGAHPVATGGLWQPRLGAEATRIFVTDDDGVFRWDPATGDRRVLLATVG